ncbi:MAG: hypothetical protein JNN30_16595 [Rhodanobacteraceae bacterium]|nr:hypothetical protein [Rhodanobacteraceae bacterium]
MSQHESLSAEFKPPPRLEPMEIMEPYVPCWCQSGKKWKFCHKGRASQKPLELGKLLHEMHLATVKGYCAHPLAGPDCGKVIAAHTIQRRGGLSKIAEAGHVLSVKEGGRKVADNNGVIIPHRIGARSASTFAGFCGIHDDKMFAPVEKGVADVEKISIFLFSFRAVAYEQFYKRCAMAYLEPQRKLDFGRPFHFQAFIQQYFRDMEHGINRATTDIGGWKHLYDQCVRNDDYAAFNGYACLFADTLPVACCGAFHPEVSFAGNQLQMISRGDGVFEHVAITLTPPAREHAIYDRLVW